MPKDFQFHYIFYCKFIPFFNPSRFSFRASLVPASVGRGCPKMPAIGDLVSGAAPRANGSRKCGKVHATGGPGKISKK